MKNKKYLIDAPIEILKGWNFKRNNSIDLNKVTQGSNEKVWWLCNECNYEWRTRIAHKVSGSGCPACSGKIITDKNRFSLLYPDLLVEWDYSLNKKNPGQYSYGTHKKINWVCKECSYKWKTSIKNRTIRNSKCPECSKKKRIETHIKNKIDKLGNLFNTHPEICKEWDYTRNKRVQPKDFTYGSDKKIWWSCLECLYSWEARINSRTKKKPTGCPACSGRVVTDKNRLSLLFPDLLKEWNFEKNKVKPENIAYAANKKIWWVCKKCNHEWEAWLNNRTTKINPRKCPKCAKGNVSKVSQEWLDSLGINTLMREHYLNGLKLRVDGFDHETNTVYEFLGDFWHGNPEIYDAEEINPKIKKSFGQLHEETFRRLRLLEKAGFKVVYIWENYFNNKEHNAINNQRTNLALIERVQT